MSCKTKIKDKESFKKGDKVIVSLGNGKLDGKIVGDCGLNSNVFIHFYYVTFDNIPKYKFPIADCLIKKRNCL
jgi:hypothetical protein|nr:MAG TPA: Transcriptional activator rfaH, Transcription Pausing, Transcription Elongation [Caudoviricetes sp.]